jgi:hypothetical protein
MRPFNIWQAPESGAEPSKVNEAPVRARSFDEAVTRHRESSRDAAAYRRRPDGSWTRGGARLFEQAIDAHAAGRQAA